MLCGKVFVLAPDDTRSWSIFWQTDNSECHSTREIQSIRYAVRIVVDRCPLPEARLTGSRQSPTARYYVSCGDKRMSGSAMGRGRWQENLRNVWWRVRSGPERILFFPVHRQQEPIQSFRASTNVVLCWFQRGRCFCMIPCTADSTRVPSTYTEESISIWR